jgi:hypothetical protein
MAGDLLVARESFACTSDDREIVVRVGDVVEAGHKIAKTYPALFEPVAPKTTHELPEGAEKTRKSRAAAPKGT